MSRLFESFAIKGLELKNRIVMPPMCQYSALGKDGMPTSWHYVHYASRAVGGTGLIIIEMTNVEPDGRISDHCLGLWSDAHGQAFAGIVKEAQARGAKVGIQIAHAGRKAMDAEQSVAPSMVFLSDQKKEARALTHEEAKGLVDKFAMAARRAVRAGVDTIELHGAHGYLIHQFHSPAFNRRDDEYGRDPALFGVEVIRAVKRELPPQMPLIMRVSMQEYMDGGYDSGYMLSIAARYREAGVDMFHVSSGGDGPVSEARRPDVKPGYMAGLAGLLRAELKMPVIAVGLLEDPALAEAVLERGDADLVAVGRGMLRDPYWADHARLALEGQVREHVPYQYARGY